jgi:hypothetical protein
MRLKDCAQHTHAVRDYAAARLVRIRSGVACGVKNVAASRERIIYFVDVQFQAAPADSHEGRLP